MTTPTPDNFTPIRAKSNGRYLCDYDPVRNLLLFKSSKVHEVIDLSEYGVPAQVAPLAVSAVGYVLLPVEVARLLGVVKGEGE